MSILSHNKARIFLKNPYFQAKKQQQRKWKKEINWIYTEGNVFWDPESAGLKTWVQMVSCQKNRLLIVTPARSANQRPGFFGG